MEKLAREALRLLVNSQRHLKIEAATATIVPLVEAPLRLGSKDAWLKHLTAFLRGRLRFRQAESTGLSFDNAILKGVQLFGVDSRVPRSQLLLVVCADGMRVYIAVDGPLSEDEATLWSDASAAANTGISEVLPEFEWWAVIGPRLRGGRPRNLAIELNLDPLRISPADFGYSETSHEGLIFTAEYDWIPTLVSGKSNGYEWYSAAHDARALLHSACCLLALVSDSPWTVREPPRVSRLEPRVLTPPDERETGHFRRCSCEVEQEIRAWSLFIDPSWMNAAWLRLIEDERLSEILAVYNEGLTMADDHPSFATIAFVSCIEAFGNLLFANPNPAQCKECKKPLFNSARSIFRQTLELVVDDPERVRRMTDDEVYRWRSSTGHSARLHGHEQTFGQGLHRWVLPPSEEREMFGVRGLDNAKDAAKDLLVKALSGELQFRPRPTSPVAATSVQEAQFFDGPEPKITSAFSSVTTG
jgi:hypothetical protein